MRGNLQVTFVQLFQDTVQTHGSKFARAYYMKRGMSAREFRLWMRVLRLVLCVPEQK